MICSGHIFQKCKFSADTLFNMLLYKEKIWVVSSNEALI